MDYTTMTEQELVDLVDAAQDEMRRRQTVEAVNKQVADVIKVARRDGAIETPEPGKPWVQPTGAHDSYMSGDVVTDAGRTWESTLDNNVWRPGQSGWREKTADGTPAEFVTPSGSHDAYNTGELVTFNGGVYKALQDGLVWSPADYPQGWEKQ